MRSAPYFHSAVLCAAILATACGGRGTVATAVPEPITASERLLAMAPDGADVVIEVDVRRLRENPVVGSTIAAVIRQRFPDLVGADEVLLCGYGVGQSAARMLTLATAPHVKAGKGVSRDGDVAMVGPDQLRALAQQVNLGTSLWANPGIRRGRKIAQPTGADGASVRAAGVFDFDARVAMGRMFDLARVPTAISVWGDIVDDLAVVAMIEAESPEDARRVAKAAHRLLQRAAQEPMVKALGMSDVIGGSRVEVGGTTVQVVVVVPPARLVSMINRWRIMKLVSPER